MRSNTVVCECLRSLSCNALRCIAFLCLSFVSRECCYAVLEGSLGILRLSGARTCKLALKGARTHVLNSRRLCLVICCTHIFFSRLMHQPLQRGVNSCSACHMVCFEQDIFYLSSSRQGSERGLKVHGVSHNNSVYVQGGFWQLQS